VNVALQIEVFVFHPVGVIKGKGHFQQFTPENPGPVHPAFEGGQDLLETRLASGGCGGVIDLEGTDLKWGPRLLQVKKH